MENGGSVDELEVPNDVVLAFESLRLGSMTQEDGLENTPPLVLRSQLYAIVDDRGQVDTEIVNVKIISLGKGKQLCPDRRFGVSDFLF